MSIYTLPANKKKLLPAKQVIGDTSVRKSWTKFGDAVDDDRLTTIVSIEEIILERPRPNQVEPKDSFCLCSSEQHEKDGMKKTLLGFPRTFGRLICWSCSVSLVMSAVATDQKTGMSRRFGFVNFVNREDGKRAINKLNGYGYDNLILRRVEWAATN